MIDSPSPLQHWGPSRNTDFSNNNEKLVPERSTCTTSCVELKESSELLNYLKTYTALIESNIKRKVDFELEKLNQNFR